MEAVTPRETEAASHRRLGLSSPKIARIMGVSHQRVSQLLNNFVLKSGERSLVEKRIFQGPRIARVSITCAICGKTFPVIETRAAGRRVCPTCPAGYVLRRVTEDSIEKVIARRLAGEQWKTLSEEYGAATATLCYRVWSKLYREGRLTKTLADRLWKRVEGALKPGSWASVARKTGRYPT